MLKQRWYIKLTKMQLNQLREYNYRKINNKYFVTNKEGDFLYLNNKDFNSLKTKKYDNGFKSLLEKSNFITTSKNKFNILLNKKNKYDFVDDGTSLHIIVPTLRCNMKCVYCQTSSQPPSSKEYDMDINTATKVVDFIFQTSNNDITIEFQGGEPTLNFGIIKHIVRYATKLNIKYRKNLEFLLVTNLNNMDLVKMHYLIDNNVNICTSFDGNKKLHDINRPFYQGNGSTYDNVVYWVKKFNSEYKKRKIDNKVYALITITKESFKYSKEIIDEYVKLNFGEINIREMTNLGCANKQWETIGYPIEDFIKFWKKSMDYIIKLNKDKIVIRERMIGIMLRKIFNIREDFLDLRSPCGAVIGQLAYNYNGDIFPCDEARMIGTKHFKLGNVLKNSYNEIIDSTKSREIVSSSINDNEYCNSCVYQNYCGICPICNYSECKNMACNIKQTARCKIYMAMFDYIIERFILNKNNKKMLDNYIGGRYG